MRDSCLFCVRKHLGKAWVLSGECALGYPQHRALVVGNMSEAEDEAARDHLELAQAIRKERLQFEKDPQYCIDFAGLCAEVESRLASDGMSGLCGAGHSLAPLLLLGAAVGGFLLLR